MNKEKEVVEEEKEKDTPPVNEVLPVPKTLPPKTQVREFQYEKVGKKSQKKQKKTAQTNKQPEITVNRRLQREAKTVGLEKIKEVLQPKNKTSQGVHRVHEAHEDVIQGEGGPVNVKKTRPFYPPQDGLSYENHHS